MRTYCVQGPDGTMTMFPLGTVGGPSPRTGQPAPEGPVPYESPNSKEFWDEFWDSFAQFSSIELKSLAKVIAMIPGWGQGVGAILNAAASLAMGETIDEVTIESACMSVGPAGGQAAIDACIVATTMAKALLEGRDYTEIAISVARAEIRQRLGDFAAATFDAAYALARGKTLQDAGFKALYYFAKGNDVAERAVHFSETLVKSIEQKKPVEDVFVEELSKQVTREVVGGIKSVDWVKMISNDIINDPSLLELNPSDLAHKYYELTDGKFLGGYGSTTESIARAAQAVLRRSADGGLVIDEQVLCRLDPLACIAQRLQTLPPSGSLTNPVSLLCQIDVLACARARMQTLPASELAAKPGPVFDPKRFLVEKEGLSPFHIDVPPPPVDQRSSFSDIGLDVMIAWTRPKEKVVT